MEVLEKIEKLRKERGWSINNLAMEALLTQSTLNNLQCFRHFSGGVFRRRRRRKKGGNFKHRRGNHKVRRLPEQGAENRAFGSAQIHALNLFCAAERTGCLRCDFLTQLS